MVGAALVLILWLLWIRDWYCIRFFSWVLMAPYPFAVLGLIVLMGCGIHMVALTSQSSSLALVSLIWD